MADIERISVEQAHQKVDAHQALLVCSLRWRRKMPDGQPWRVHLADELSLPRRVSAEDAGTHLLLCLTQRRQCCRSGSEVPVAGVYQRQGTQGRRWGVDRLRLSDDGV